MRLILILLIIVVLLVSGCAQQSVNIQTTTQTPQVTDVLMPLKLTSPEFENNSKIPSKFTCDGQNTNPPLKISGTHPAAKSLVLIVDDPDAVKPAGKVWDHWVLWNIDPTIKEIKENSVPSGSVQGKNGSGKSQYQGPCPPDAEHRYFFKLYALGTTLNLKEGSTKSDVENAMNGHILEKAELIGKYERV